MDSLPENESPKTDKISGQLTSEGSKSSSTLKKNHIKNSPSNPNSDNTENITKFSYRSIDLTTKIERMKILESNLEILGDDDYLILEPLGEGGFSKVYKINFRKDQSFKALKVLHNPDEAANEYIFLDELNNLNHPNILKFYGAYKLKDSSVGLILEYGWVSLNQMLMDYKR